MASLFEIIFNPIQDMDFKATHAKPSLAKHFHKIPQNLHKIVSKSSLSELSEHVLNDCAEICCFDRALTKLGNRQIQSIKNA